MIGKDCVSLVIHLSIRYSHPREPAYWSRQSLSSPSPVETEMDLLVLRERSRRGIRNNGYDVSNHIHLLNQSARNKASRAQMYWPFNYSI